MFSNTESVFIKKNKYLKYQQPWLKIWSFHATRTVARSRFNHGPAKQKLLSNLLTRLPAFFCLHDNKHQAAHTRSAKPKICWLCKNHILQLSLWISHPKRDALAVQQGEFGCVGSTMMCLQRRILTLDADVELLRIALQHSSCNTAAAGVACWGQADVRLGMPACHITDATHDAHMRVVHLMKSRDMCDVGQYNGIRKQVAW